MPLTALLNPTIPHGHSTARAKSRATDGMIYSRRDRIRCKRSFEAVDLLGIAAEDRAALGLAHGDLDGEARVVVVPVRIVARVDDAVPADPIEDGAQVLRVLRLLDRLRRVPQRSEERRVGKEWRHGR